MLDAVLPVVVLIVLIAITIWLFGVSATDGPLQVALLLSEQDSPRVVQAWFQGLNPHLEDRSPARLLRDGELDEVGPLVLAAARAFLVGA